MKRLAFWKFVAAACAVVLAACGGDPTGADPVELQRAIQQWNAQDIDDYRMMIRRQGGMIGGAAIITVRDGETVSVQAIAPTEEMPAGFFEPFNTVEKLFHILTVAHERAARIDAEYHPRLGVPLDVYVDPAKNVVDEEYGFEIEAFEVL